MKKFKKIYIVLIAIIIPVFIITAAVNITLRSPEVYSYYFNESQSIDYTTISLTSNQLAEQISDFTGDFFGEEVDITENTGYADDPIFNDQEAEILFEMRSYLTKSLIIMIIALVIGLILYIAMLRKEEEKALFRSCQVAVLITGIIILVSGIALKISKVRTAFYDAYIAISLSKDSVLKTLFTKGDFWGTVDLVYIAISIILTLIVLYVSWRLTKPYKIFK